MVAEADVGVAKVELNAFAFHPGLMQKPLAETNLATSMGRVDPLMERECIVTSSISGS